MASCGVTMPATWSEGPDGFWVHMPEGSFPWQQVSAYPCLLHLFHSAGSSCDFNSASQWQEEGGPGSKATVESVGADLTLTWFLLVRCRWPTALPT